MKNNVIIEGYIQFEPTIKQVKGTQMCTLKICNKVGTNTSYFTVLCFGNLADTVHKYYEKSNYIYVDGILSQRSWEGKQIIEIKTNSIFLHSNKEIPEAQTTSENLPFKYMIERNVIHLGDVKSEIKKLPSNSVDCVVTSPPYFGLRSYTEDECEIGNEQTLEEYIDTLVEVFEEVRRVLKPTGVFYLNIGDSYSGSGKGRNKDGTIHESALTSKQGTNKSVKGNIKGSGYKPNGIKRKELMNVPHRLVLALSDAGWYHRDTIVWAKATSGQVREGSVMPSSVTDRFSPAFEYIFMLTKSVKYYFDQYGVKETISNSSISRLNQDIENQIGTTKANGGKKNNGNFKAVGDIESGLVNMRNVWRINLQPGSNGQHIAGYPEKLVEPCIKTATSKKGNCVECGNPYERVLEKDGVNDQNSWNRSGAIDKLKTSKGIHGKTSTFLTDTTTNYKHIGWQKTCKCQTNDISLPIVLDPFMGSGTTALVALKNGCDFIGFELNPEYIEIANKRISPYMNINKFY